jgi:hypothetical protein
LLPLPSVVRVSAPSVFGSTSPGRSSKRRSDTKRVNRNCSGPVTTSDAAVRQVTACRNATTGRCASDRPPFAAPTTSIDTMEETHGPEPTSPA